MERESPSSVILHVDLDCFYAAVEHARLGIPFETPLAVQQWEGLIAVNYAARVTGIVRHDRVADALRKCPDLQLVHVETIGNDKGDVAARRDTSKVSLERYRQASRCVFEIFHQHADICERASIDEAYLDVTKKVETFLSRGCNWGQEIKRLVGHAGEKASMVIEGGSTELCDPVYRRLLAGAIIAERIRTDVRSKLGYTCSVGIATNKLLAKIASARNKPDQQTLILPGAVADLMDALPLKKVKLLGGKFGEELAEKWSCKTAGDAQKVPLKSLLASFGDRLGNYVYKAVRGIHEDKVQEKQTTKSMLAAKSFQATNDLSVIRMWLGVLAEELSVRMLRDAKENHRQPHSLQLYYRSGMSRQSGDHSKSCSMPHTVLRLLASACFETARVSVIKQQPDDLSAPSGERLNNCIMLKFNEEIESDRFISEGKHDMESEADKELLPLKKVSSFSNEESNRTYVQNSGTSVDSKETEDEETVKDLSNLLQQASFQLFQRVEDALPCTRLAIAASGFHNAPVQGSQSIQHFFGNAAFKGRNMPSIQPHTTGPVGGDNLVNKQKGMLRYLDKGLKKPSGVACESEGLSSMRKDTEITVQADKPDFAKRTCFGSLVDQSADVPLEDALVASETEQTLDLSDSAQCVEGPMDHQGGSTILDLDLKDVDVDEQCRIWNEICTARSASNCGNDTWHAKVAHSSAIQAAKRRKSKSSSFKPVGQQSLSKFFDS